MHPNYTGYWKDYYYINGYICDCKSKGNSNHLLHDINCGAVINNVKQPSAVKSDISEPDMHEFQSDIRPDYYNTDSPYEPRKIIEHYSLNFNLGNVIKYVLRPLKFKNKNRVEDLRKARTYINFEIERLEKEERCQPKTGISSSV